MTLILCNLYNYKHYLLTNNRGQPKMLAPNVYTPSTQFTKCFAEQSCVVVQLYFSGPQVSWSVHVCCLHLKMEFRSCAKGASVVWHYLLLLMNSFNKTDAAVFSCRLCFQGAFPFISFIITCFRKSEYVFCLNSSEKMGKSRRSIGCMEKIAA